MPDQETPAGWYPTPDGRQRYWDGTGWTENYAPTATASPPPKKKGGALKWILLVVGLVIVLGLGSCIALVVSAGDEVSKSLESVASDLESTPSGDGSDVGSDGSGDESNPVEIKDGQGFDVRGFTYAAGWKITGDEFGMNTEGLKVTNNRDQKDSALVDIRFWNGTEVLASISCSSEPILPGTTVTLTCFSGDKKPKDYDRLTISDTF